MKKFLHFLLLVMTFAMYGPAQNIFPAEELQKFTANTILKQEEYEKNSEFLSQGSIPRTNLIQFFQRQDSALNIDLPSGIDKHSKSLDTMFVGLIPGDSVYVTGGFFNDGPVVVFGDGVLIFENADAVINGDMYVWGSDARIEIRNSVMNFPQFYIYQRRMVAVAGGLIKISGSVLNYSGLQHDLYITDSSKVVLKQVQTMGFTTCGLTSHAQFEADSISKAEFILLDYSSLSIENTEFILLWHHVPDTSSLSVSFPDGTHIAAYAFSDTLPGVQDIHYTYSLTNCSDVMWGLMPEPGSQVIVSDSEIRTIGVWFRDQPAYEVSGLVNNSYYSNFTAPLSDHSIQLINTHVQTWSLYLFKNAQGTIENCILGEIGIFNNGITTVSNTMVDGSGGYMFAGDTSKLIFGYGYLNCDFHTNGNALGILAYSGQNWGRCIAKDKSIMIVIQSNLSQEPEYLHDAVVWYAKLDGSATVYADSIIPVSGSAWIEKASDFYSMDMAWYKLDYSVSGTDQWFPVCGKQFQEVHTGNLCNWNTYGLDPATYLLRLTMCDNTIDSNKVEAVMQFIMIPSVASLNEGFENGTTMVYPNPTSGKIFLKNNSGNDIINIELSDISGRMLDIDWHGMLRSGCSDDIDLSFLAGGTYLLMMEQKNGIVTTHKIQINTW